MTPEIRKMLLIWLLISVLAGVTISILMHGVDGIIESYPVYFLPLAIGSLTGILIAQGRRTPMTKGASMGFAGGLILIVIVSGFSV